MPAREIKTEYIGITGNRERHHGGIRNGMEAVPYMAGAKIRGFLIMDKNNNAGAIKFLKLSRTARLMIASAAVICLILLAVGLVVINFIYKFEGNLQFAVGVLIGGVFSLANIIMLEKSLKMAVNAGKKKASGLGVLFSFIRYLIMAGVLVSAFIFPQIGRIGAIAGILIPTRLSAYAAGILLKK